MADLAASAVTINDTWWDGDRWGKAKWLVRDVTLVLSGQGTVANAIGADVLGLSEVHKVETIMTDGDTLLLGSPSYDRSQILLYSMIQSVDANRANPADFTDTVRMIVKGKEA